MRYYHVKNRACEYIFVLSIYMNLLMNLMCTVPNAVLYTPNSSSMEINILMC